MTVWLTQEWRWNRPSNTQQIIAEHARTQIETFSIGSPKTEKLSSHFVMTSFSSCFYGNNSGWRSGCLSPTSDLPCLHTAPWNEISDYRLGDCSGLFQGIWFNGRERNGLQIRKCWCSEKWHPLLPSRLSHPCSFHCEPPQKPQCLFSKPVLETSTSFLPRPAIKIPGVDWKEIKS